MEIFDILDKFYLAEMKNVLVIQPHPDDAEIGCGNVIAKIRNNGSKIHYLTVTDGSLGITSDKYEKDIVSIRKREAEQSGRFLGASDFHFLDYEDGSLESIPDLSAKLAEEIRIIKPDLILAPDPWLTYEAHNDHIITGKSAAQAFISSNLLKYPKTTKTAPHQARFIGFYFTEYPNCIIDVSDTMEDMFKAIGMHESQIDEKTMQLYRMYFTYKAQALGEKNGYMFGAGLKILQPIMMHCFTETSLYRI